MTRMTSWPVLNTTTSSILKTPDYNRIHVERVEGLAPDPNGVMRMRNVKDIDRDSSTYQNVFNARAKGLFARSSGGQILIWFRVSVCKRSPRHRISCLSVGCS